MTGTWQGTARAPHRRRAAAGAATALVAAAVLGSASSALAFPHARQAAAGASSSGTRHAAAGLRTTGSGTPSGRAPVAFRQGQLSVPPTWLVESPQQLFCRPRGSSMIFVGTGPRFPAGTGCRPTARLAWIRPAGHIPPGIWHHRPTAVIHGIAVYRLRSGPHSVLYLLPELGLRVGARGPLARRVLATLTWSPLSVVLRRGPASRVPASWTWYRF